MDYRNKNLRQEYLKQSVMTASPCELIVMLYDSCIKNLKLAEICLTENNDLSGAHTHFRNAQDIIMELINCLDPGVELSAKLLDIYEYLLRTLRDMNIKKDLTLLPDMLDILTSIRDTWQQISKSSYGFASEVSAG
ncbi:flagellar protein FliS [Sporobacter termitidis DSM 10068]|uniref:Flagellar secretion chaperone FliS n=1 Tax=Sporobacter termitidis DSM 10068 TaxID=1123282 RepID=A0A1M5W9H1_9FIRM|nr:flagellar export chaperone FliS [Sporobacter termitidis]SHH84115.1 flagellar protein FliS [Sporobacter termitidis DSM 10068]